MTHILEKERKYVTIAITPSGKFGYRIQDNKFDRETQNVDRDMLAAKGFHVVARGWVYPIPRIGDKVHYHGFQSRRPRTGTVYKVAYALDMGERVRTIYMEDGYYCRQTDIIEILHRESWYDQTA